jgi:membrane protease subunit HflK
MQEILDRFGAGISVTKASMQNAQPPEQVQAAFDDIVNVSLDWSRRVSKPN